MGYTDYEWRNLHSGWQYKGDAPKDTQWQKDRQKLFKENGNGWWWLTACKTTHTREN